MTVEVTIGWTKSAMPEYSSFADGYRPGAEQHTETIEVEIPEGTYAFEIPAKVADATYMATNHPYPESLTGLAREIYEAIKATGYTGRGAHYSLSVGDTVTVGEIMLACAALGWERVSAVSA